MENISLKDAFARYEQEKLDNWRKGLIPPTFKQFAEWLLEQEYQDYAQYYEQPLPKSEWIAA